MLKLNELESFGRLSPGDVPALRAAVYRLHNHLDDRLVEVEALEVGRAAVVALRVFPGRNGKRTPLFAALTRAGDLAVGRLDAMETSHRSVQLNGYEPARTDVVALLVTERFRPIGDRLDLFAVVCDATRPDIRRAYHGIVWLDENDTVHLDPARDDSSGNAAVTAWQPIDAIGLPDWLIDRPLNVPEDLDVFDPGTTDSVTALLKNCPASANTVAVARQFLAYSSGDRLTIVSGPRGKAEPAMHSINESIHALTLDREPVRRKVKQLIAGCDDYTLRAYGVEQWKITESWRQALPGLAMTLALAEQREDAPASILIGLHTGRLLRARQIASKDLGALWQALWKQLGLYEKERALADLEELCVQPDPDEPSLVADVAHIIDSLTNSNISSATTLLDRRLVNALATVRYKTVLSAARKRLICRLERLLEKQTVASSPAVDRIADLTLQVYQYSLPIIERESIDGSIRVLANCYPLSFENDHLAELLDRSKRTREILWHNEREDPSLTKQISAAEWASLGLSRWSSAFVPAHTLGDKPDRMASGIPKLGYLYAKSRRWLAIARGNRINLHEIRAHGCLSPDCRSIEFEEPIHDTFRCGPPIDDELTGSSSANNSRPDDHLLVVGRRGLCRLYGIDAEHPTEPVLLERTTRRPPEHDDATVAMASICSHVSGDGCTLALIVRKAKSHWLRIYRIMPATGSIELLGEPRELQVSGIACIELGQASDAGDYQVFVGVDRPGPVYRLHLNGEGALLGIEHIFKLPDSAVSLRLDAIQNARRLLIGTASGLAWCVDLTPESALKIAWTYRLNGSIRRIARHLMGDGGGEGHRGFLLGSEYGTLCLLRAGDGARIWTTQLEQPVRRLITVLAKVPRLAIVALSGGAVASYVALDSQARLASFAESGKYLQSAREALRMEEPTVIRNSPDTDSAIAFRELLNDPSRLSGIIERHSLNRETSARLVRYVVENDLPLDEAQRHALVRQLTYRNIKLLLHYLQSGAVDEKRFRLWRDAITDALHDKRSTAVGDNSAGARDAAWAAYLSVAGNHADSARQFLGKLPPVDVVSRSWVNVACVRGLLQTLVRAPGGGNQVPGLVIENILGLPPALLTGVPSLFAPKTKNNAFWDALQRSLSEHNAATRLEAMAELAEALAAERDTSNWVTFVRHLLRVVIVHARHAAQPWEKWRSIALAQFRDLCETVVAYRSRRQPSDEVVECVRDMFAGIGQFPDGSMRRQGQLSWFNEMLVAVRTFEVENRLTELHYWQRIGHDLLKRLRMALIAICEHELSFLDTQVRAYLVPTGSFIPDHEGQVSLNFRVDPEGRQVLRRVSVSIDAGVPGGLLAPGIVRQVFDFTEYPAEHARRDLVLSGRVRLSQKAVRIRVQLLSRDSGHRDVDESWCFPLVWPQLQTEAKRQALTADVLSWLHKRYFVEIDEDKSPVLWLIYDPGPERAMFLNLWDARDEHLRLSIDATLSEHQSRHNQIVPVSKLIEDVEDRLRDPTLANPAGRHRPQLLLGPTDELFALLKSTAGRTALLDLLRELRRFSRNLPHARLRVLVSSDTMSYLRGLGTGLFQELDFPLLLKRELQKAGSSASPIRTQLAAVAARQLGGHDDELFNEAVMRLGADLNLIVEWLDWAGQQQANRSIDDFLGQKHIVDRIRKALSSLSTLEYLTALAGSMSTMQIARSRLKRGQIAAEDYYSTTQKHQQKRLQAAGSAFTDASIDRLHADRQPPAFVVVEGVGHAGDIVKSIPFLKRIVASLDSSTLEKLGKRLDSQGIGHWMGGVFRTGSPYRDYLRLLDARYAREPEAKRYTHAFQDVVGPDRWLAEGLTPEHFAGWSWHELQPMMPGTPRKEVIALLALAELWRQDGTEAKVESALKQTFDRWVLLRDSERTASLWPAGVLAYRPGRVEGENLPDILLWLQSDWGQAAASGQNAKAETCRQELGTLSRIIAHGNAGNSPSLVLAMGPGVEALGADDRRRIALLRFSDVRTAACRGSLYKELTRIAGAQSGLVNSSPFQTTGSLPPGSKLFFGRDRELGFITQHLQDKSILVVGARRIGKTSLLNQIWHWAKGQPQWEPLFVDLQGVNTAEQFCARLRSILSAATLELSVHREDAPRQDEVYQLLALFCRQARAKERQPLFLFNEIDGIATTEPKIFESWRSAQELPFTARYVLVGYTVAGELNDMESPFYQWTAGDRYGGRALAPTTLDDVPARAILALLETQSLALRWPSDEERDNAYEHLLDRSYRIPWVLQRYGQLLVEIADQRGGDTLRYDDTLRVTSEHGGVVWDFLQRIEYDKLGHKDGTPVDLRHGFQAVLFALARARYFLGGDKAAIQDPGLTRRHCLDSDLAFTLGDVRRIVRDTMTELLQGQDELNFFERWFDSLDLQHVFPLLTLTMILESDPADPNRYGFTMHMLPRELWHQHGQTDPRLHSKWVEIVEEFLKHAK